VLGHTVPDGAPRESALESRDVVGEPSPRDTLGERCSIKQRPAGGRRGPPGAARPLPDNIARTEARTAVNKKALLALPLDSFAVGGRGPRRGHDGPGHRAHSKKQAARP
jgi:hypothetical protein